MADPTAADRQAVYTRDVFRCVRCGGEQLLTVQHRAAVGMGGTKVRPSATELLTACLTCNEAFEHALQNVALLHGWKVPRWLQEKGKREGVDLVGDVPVYYAPERIWCVLILNARMHITEEQALATMRDIYGPQYDEWRLAA